MSGKNASAKRIDSGRAELRRKAPARQEGGGKRGAAEAERMSQFTLKMRESLHRELARLALDAGMTMRGYIMNALKSKGLSVTEADLIDRRKR